MDTAQSPVMYLRSQLKFTMGEWNALSDTDKTQLKSWAREEMTFLGLPIAEK